MRTAYVFTDENTPDINTPDSSRSAVFVFGVGKFLRTSRYDQRGFTPSIWRETSVPHKPVRGIYFVTHFYRRLQ